MSFSLLIRNRGNLNKGLTVELFYSENIEGNVVRLYEEESGHCIRVLRHRAGDEIDIIDGRGALLHCRIVSERPKSVEAEVISRLDGWNAHPYRLTMAVCPTKNIDRYEWFAEKATEMGVDVIVPLIGEHSERRTVKTQRLEKIVLSAAKQSLKGAVPEIAGPVSVRDFIMAGIEAFSDVPDDLSKSVPADACTEEAADKAPLKLIACCFEDAGHPRKSVKEALAEWLGADFPALTEKMIEAYEENTLRDGRLPDTNLPEITVLIGPEGDFSSEELRIALEHGYIPVHLGPSRLRTETAALLCVEEVYSALML